MAVNPDYSFFIHITFDYKMKKKHYILLTCKQLD